MQKQRINIVFQCVMASEKVIRGFVGPEPVDLVVTEHVALQYMTSFRVKAVLSLSEKSGSIC